ncbi:hypothetical protein GALL_325380 [mine drainage metagenome]|uniref:Uncharacterized protein n=1 Tax=mine drainage metagenome TaxID=410659 RepID=A0A1J5QPQ7_9ZZZZ
MLVSEIVFLVALVLGMYYLIKRARDVRSGLIREKTAEEEKDRLAWGRILIWMLFAVNGVDWLVTGRGDFDFGPTAGMTVRIGGGLMFVMSMKVITDEIRRKLRPGKANRWRKWR